MKLATFTHAGATRIGAVSGDRVIDFAAVPGLPQRMSDLLAAGPEAMARARDAAQSAARTIALEDVRLEAPVPNPPEFLAIGRNYADHVQEMGFAEPEFPRFFNKQVTCITGPFDPIHRPRVSEALDYEGEMGIVIGRRCRYVPRARAHEVIAGYVVVNDVSVRDWQAKAATVTLGKSFDTHGPFGPWITTSDEVPDPHVLELRTWVNGELRQHSNTRYMLHDCYRQIEILSTVFTLLPGMIISTGTPSGVAHGMKPPRYLKAGDIVRIEVEKVGVIENRIVEEPDSAAVI
jgi:2-keto-4-pentenoate hydratase/2-oxohepta-3-ene-1,7-dioic acid hydratase in catechol pathway